MLILVPAAIVVICAAQLALGLFGPLYAADGTRVLRLLALATLPRALTEMYLGALRAQSRTSLIALIQGSRAIAILGLAFVLTGIMGTTGAGLAVLATQVIVAAAVAPSMLSLLRRKPSLAARPVPPTSV